MISTAQQKIVNYHAVDGFISKPSLFTAWVDNLNIDLTMWLCWFKLIYESNKQ